MSSYSCIVCCLELIPVCDFDIWFQIAYVANDLPAACIVFSQEFSNREDSLVDLFNKFKNHYRIPEESLRRVSFFFGNYMESSTS